jgi:cyanophycin synthetase
LIDCANKNHRHSRTPGSLGRVLLAASLVAALGLAGPGDVVLVLYEKLAPVLDVLAELGAVRGGATPVPALPTTPAPGAVAIPARDLVRGAVQG